MRVPEAQSTTRCAAAASACWGSRVRNSSVSRIRRVPKTNTSTPRPEPTTACRNSSSARVYASIDPETSQSTTSLRGTSMRRRKVRSIGSPPRASERRARRRRSSLRPRACGRSRRECRSGRAAATSAIAFDTCANSSAVIAAKSFRRSTSCTLQPTSVVSSPRSSPPPVRSVRVRSERRGGRSRGVAPRYGGREGERRNHAANARSKLSRSSARETSVVRSAQ